MALNKVKLKRDLESYFKEIGDLKEAYSAQKTATDLFDIYSDYAMDAVDPSGDRPMVVTRSALSILVLEFSSKYAGEGIRKALVTFWTGATFQVLVPHSTMSQETTSVVVGMDPSILNDLFIQNYEDSALAAAYLADKLHDFTTSVTVLITGLAKVGSPPLVITASGSIS